MKNFKLGIFSLLAILAVSVFLTSCEQDALISTVDTLETSTEEGFNSTTPTTTEGGLLDEPVFHATFDGDMTGEEVDEQVRKMLDDYISNLDTGELKNRGVSTDWYSVIRFRTGSQAYNNTRGSVKVKSHFKTNRGSGTHTTSYLSSAGHKKGKWDAYVRRNYRNGQTVSWVEAKWVELGLRGTDEWFVTNLRLHVVPGKQSIRSTGSSHIYSTPNVLLQSSHSSGWDFYKAHGGYGRLNF